MSLNPCVTQDPILIEAIKHMFHWANEMGLQGTKVLGLHLYDPNIGRSPIDPPKHLEFWCKIEKGGE